MTHRRHRRALIETFEPRLLYSADLPDRRGLLRRCSAHQRNWATVLPLSSSKAPTSSLCAEVLAPTVKVRCVRPELPEVEIQAHDHFALLLEAAKSKGPLITAIVHPVKANAIEAAFDAAREGLIRPVLVGPEARVLEAAAQAGVDISAWEIVDAEHSHAAATKACELAAAGRVDAVMKGSLHSDEILGAVVSPNSGLRTNRRVSHTYVLDVPSYPKPLFITDAAINVAPGKPHQWNQDPNALDAVRRCAAHLSSPSRSRRVREAVATGARDAQHRTARG